MNEQIKQFIKQATIYYPATKSSGEFSIFDKEKFAELIVGECIEVIDSTSDNIKLMRVDPYQKIIWAIEQHFGVEE